jgi:mRNA interferase MazF
MAKRGEIYEVNWSPGRGSEQAGIRPALVIQNDVGNEFSPTTIVAAVSSRPRRPYPFHVAITARESGLPQDSIVKCEQIQTIAQCRLERRVGRLNPSKMREVDVAIMSSLGIES